jgi:steroid delta-isomerase-like uncharacterized protein
MGPKETVQAWFERVWNQGDEAAIDDLFAKTAISHGLPGGDIVGSAAFKPFAKKFRSAIPNIKITILRSVTEGNSCAAFCEVVGTHTGDHLGFSATGSPVHFTGTVFVRVENGQIQEGWNSFDFLTFYQQLGHVPELG